MVVGLEMNEGYVPIFSCDKTGFPNPLLGADVTTVPSGVVWLLRHKDILSF